MSETGTLQCTNTSPQSPAPMHGDRENTNELHTEHTDPLWPLMGGKKAHGIDIVFARLVHQAQSCTFLQQ